MKIHILITFIFVQLSQLCADDMAVNAYLDVYKKDEVICYDFMKVKIKKESITKTLSRLHKQKQKYALNISFDPSLEMKILKETLLWIKEMNLTDVRLHFKENGKIIAFPLNLSKMYEHKELEISTPDK